MVVLSIIVFTAHITSAFIKNRKKALYAQAIAYAFETIYSLCIGAYTVSFLSVLCLIRTIVFSQNDSIKDKFYFMLLISFEIVIIANCIYTWNGLISLVPTIGSIIRTYFIWQNDMKLIRVSNIVNGVTYAPYYAFYGSWLMFAGYTVLALAGIYSVYKNDIQKSLKKAKCVV